MTSLMLSELRESPDVVERMLTQNEATVAARMAEWRASAPSWIATVARGSSDHASAFFCYSVMARLGVPAWSMPPSVMRFGGGPQMNPACAVIALSQSGASPDLIDATRAARDRGAQTHAWVNAAGSALAEVAQLPLALHAGIERSVAATKSCIAQMVCGQHFVSHWLGDAAMLQGLRDLPTALRQACERDTTSIVEALTHADHAFVIARGAGLAVAQEMALKLQETSGIHAQAYSAAEVQHGPMALIQPGFVVLSLASAGPDQASVRATAAALAARGAQVVPLEMDGLQVHEALAPIAALQRFYAACEALARARGRDPDQPPHLSKVTQTR
jgi:glutamine---fructose-6-phosphate transaminase (isomerizing)